MPKTSGDFAVEIELEFDPFDYNNYEDLISAIEQQYGRSINELPDLSFDAEDERFQDNQEIEEEEEEINDNSSNDREITTSDISTSNETSGGISKAVRGFLGRFRL